MLKSFPISPTLVVVAQRVVDANDLPISISLVDISDNESAAYETTDAANRPGVDGHKPTISNVTFNITSGL